MVNENRIAKIVQTRFSKLYSNQQEIFDQVEEYHQMYRSIMTESDAYPWDYQLVDPVVFYLLRSMMARLNPDSMKVRLEARNSQAKNCRDINQALINWELSEIRKTLVFYRFLFRGLLGGRAYLSTGWKYEPAVEVLSGPGEGVKKIMRGIVNRAEAKNVRFQDMFIPNHNIPDLEEQPYLIERVCMRFGDMLDDNEAQDKEVWKKEYLDKIRDKKMFVTKIDYGVELPSDDEEKMDGRGKEKKDMFTRSQYVSLLKMQTKEGDVIYTPEKENEWVLNTTQENPYWHGHYNYISWTPFPEDDEFFSMGIVQPIADLQIAASSTLNQYLSTARKLSNPMTIIGGPDNAKVPDWMFISRPDGIIRTPGDATQIQQFKQADHTSTMIEMRKELQTMIERTTAMSSLYASGVSGGTTPQANKTATGAKIIDSNLDLNIQLIVALFGAQGLTTMGDHFQELNAQFMTEEQEFKLTGQTEIYKIRPEEVTANFEIITNPDTIIKVSPVVKQAALLNLKALADEEKDVKLDKKPLWKAIIDSYPEMDNVGEIVVDAEQEAQQAIDAIVQGGEAKANPNQDHKLIIKIVQKYLIDAHAAGKPLDDQTLQTFAEYLDEHRKFLEAEKMMVTMQQPQPPAQPGMLPTNPQDLAASMTGGMNNPMQNMPNPIPQDQIPGAPLPGVPQ